MDTSLFDYVLPSNRIAQSSVEPRDVARLLVLDRTSRQWENYHIFDLPDLLHAGDLLVFNDSKVFKARLKAEGIELFLLRPDGDAWIALAKPGRRLKVNSTVTLANGMTVQVLEKLSDGTIRLDFGLPTNEVFELCDRLGEVPIPPYVKPNTNAASGYQTVYAKTVGSVAAPTAGFHFTNELLEQLQKRSIKLAFVTLHVGLGTFRPMKADTLEAHEMHEEWADVLAVTIDAIRTTKAAGHRIIVVGTTAMRALESASATEHGLVPFSGFTKLFITPGYKFKVADGLLTNFHLPKSSLLVLVSAFAGREFILDAYQYAIHTDYRFYSFGDAMLIL